MFLHKQIDYHIDGRSNRKRKHHLKLNDDDDTPENKGANSSNIKISINMEN